MAVTVEEEVFIEFKADMRKFKRDMDKMKGDTKKTADSMGRSFKTAFIGLGALVAASGIKELIATGLKYNSVLEVTQNSIAGLLVATSKLEDENGKVITQQQLYNNAMAESVTILDELRVINAETPVGLEETANIYKTMLPSMRQVGAEQSELIELTKNLAIASGVAGLKTQQLLAGVDGLATGTVLANSELGRFLTALGLSNKELKESTDVVGLLNRELGKLKGEITMDMQLSTLNEAWSSTLGAMTKTMWTESKEWIQALIDYLNNFKEGVKLIPVLFQAMTMAVRDIWKITMLQLTVWYEEFIDVVKIAINWMTSLGSIELGFNVDLENAKLNLSDMKDSFKTGKEHFIDLVNTMPKAVEGMATVGKDTKIVSDEIKKITAGTKATVSATNDLTDSVNAVAVELTDVEILYEDIAFTAQDAMGDAFRSWQDGALSFKETMRDVLNDIAAMIFEKLVVKQLFDNIGGLLGGGGGFSSILGQFADGGTAYRSGSYIVGERGAEVVTLPAGASVTPNEQLGGSTVINVNNYGNDNVDVQQNENSIDIIISQIANGISRGTGAVGTAIEQRYSLSKT